jgi:hypothetical protein
VSRRKKHNPEKRSWKGKSHKKGGQRVRILRDKGKRDQLSRERLAG